MKQILQNLKTGKTLLAEAPMPARQAGCLTIASTCSLVSAGTERMLVEFGRAGFIRKAKAQPDKVKRVLDKMGTDGVLPTVEAVFRKLDEPLPLGYCNVGKIERADTGRLSRAAARRAQKGSRAEQRNDKAEGVVDNFKPGDRVVSNGAHAEVVSVPQRLCAKIPDVVRDEEAAFAVLGAIGLQGISLTGCGQKDRVVVYGLGLIGLLSVQILKTRGCEVFGIDLSPPRLALAEQFGVKVCNAATADPVPAVTDWADHKGAHAVLITASAKKDDIVHKSAQMCRKHGKIVLVGVTDLNLRRSDFYEKELRFQVSCSYGSDRYEEADPSTPQRDYSGGTVGENLDEVLRLMADGRLDVKPLISHRVPFEEASKAYQIIREAPSALGVILEYGQPMTDHGPRTTISVESTGVPAKTSSVVAGVIGSGNFVKATLMPAIQKTGVRVKYVASQGGASAAYVARKFGSENATSDYGVLLKDDDVNAIVIATQHDLHARMVCEALATGKHVFVEKPLCLNADELESIGKVVQENDRILLVGFNRRFSPHAAKVKELLAGRHGPLCMNMTVNAGEISADHWVHDPVKGGGRIIGEGCHFIDLLSYIAGSAVVTVSATMVGPGPVVREDKMSIILGFADGSVGTINYFANGTKSYPKEMLEVFSDGRVLRIENFRTTRGFGVKGFRKFKRLRQDKGHVAELAAFVDAVSTGGQSPITFDELTNVTRASFAAFESARERRVVDIS